MSWLRIWLGSRTGRIALIVLGIIVASVLAWVVAWETHVGHVTCHVTQTNLVDADFSRTGSVTDVARVVRTENCGTLDIEDDPLRLSFDSGRIFREIKPGFTYRFYTIGWRGNLFSTLPNVVNVTSVP